MEIFKFTTKNKIDIDEKPKVYFACHPDDFSIYYEKICQDIFKTHDCVIYYKKDFLKSFTKEERETDLSRFNLFVVPVTYKLLSTPNLAMNEDIKYAFSQNISVLPLMMESGLEALYAAPDKFGTRQYLNPNSKDLTEIFYEQKLQNYLNSVLISPELQKKIRDAFDAYIFLSYRKMNRKYANELMRFIHLNPECRDIAIWFDEFLIPGESFSKAIEEKLENSELFTLLVTPDIFKKVKDLKTGELRDNYVVSKELPLAKKHQIEKGTEILAVEMEKTDKNSLSLLEINDSVSFEDKEFKKRLLNSVSKIARLRSDSPEHNFLIGLAYLEGIDVEVNRERGMALITQSAEGGFLEAMKKLRDMYREGLGVPVDYKQAIKWSDRVYIHFKNTYGEDDVNTLISYGNLAYCHHCDGNYIEAIKIYEKVYKLSLKCEGMINENLPVLINNMASSYLEAGDINEALKYHSKAYDKLVMIKGEADPLTMKVLSNLGASYDNNGFTKQALPLLKKVYKLQKKNLEENHPDTLLSLNNLACAQMAKGDFHEALKNIKEAYSLSVDARGKEYCDSILFLANLAMAYRKTGDYTQARILYEEALKLRCETLGETHPDSILSLNLLASAQTDEGFPEKANTNLIKALELSKKHLGYKHKTTALILNNLAKTYHSSRKFEVACKIQDEAYTLYCELFGENHPKTADVAYNLGVALSDNNEFEKAYSLFKKAYDSQLKHLGKEHPYTVDSLYAMTKTALELDCDDIYKKYCKSASIFHKVYEIRSKTSNIDKADVLSPLKDEAYCNLKLGNNKEAHALYIKVLKMEKEVYPMDFGRHTDTQNVIKMLESRIKK